MELRYLTDKEIDQGKRDAIKKYGNYYPAKINYAPIHEHNDCIRLAYTWLDAQKTVRTSFNGAPIKDYVQQWACRDLSSSDVVVAALMHPVIKGTYPYFNISKSFVFPSCFRKDGISEADKQKHYGRDTTSVWCARGAHKRIETIENGEFTIYNLPNSGARKRTKERTEKLEEINDREFKGRGLSG